MKRRLTPARRASAAMLSGWPVSRVASRAASTWLVLFTESSRRAATSRSACPAAVCSAIAGLQVCGPFDGGEEHRRVLCDGVGEFGGETHGKLCPLGADGGDGFLGGGTVLLVQRCDHFVVGAQQLAHGVDRFLGGGGVAPVSYTHLTLP